MPEMETTSRPKSFTLPPKSNQSNRQSIPSDSSLFCSAYDGSHLSWQDFRSTVLAPYGIHIIGQPPENRLPFELWKLIEVRNQGAARFEGQKKEFKAQVSTGQGFGPSPLFPPNLLPPEDNSSGLARCMIPRFRREPLPERVRAPEKQGSLYGLSTPHPGLACGLTQYAFDPQEFSMLPHYLSVEGVNVNFETGYVSSHTSVHCPFLTFERAAGARHDQLERANNQCAIAGAWCVRALHMLYNKAYKATVIPDLPTAFSCIINNSFAILNYHWIDHAQEFYMAPLCKFDLRNDAHFTKFLVWTEAIGDWGVRYQLPRIKSALSRLIQFSPTPTVTSIPSLSLSPSSNGSSESGIVRALRMKFDTIPWRLDEAAYTPVSSSSADWGSPQNIGDGFTPISRASTHSWGSPIDDPDFPYPSGPKTSLRSLKLERRGLSLSLGNQSIPELVTSPPTTIPTTRLEKELSEAQNEIRDLKDQLQLQRTEYEESVSSLRSEISEVKEILLTLLRKQNVQSKVRSFSCPNSPQMECWSTVPSPAQLPPPPQYQFQPQRPFPTEDKDQCRPQSPRQVHPTESKPDSESKTPPLEPITESDTDTDSESETPLQEHLTELDIEQDSSPITPRQTQPADSDSELDGEPKTPRQVHPTQSESELKTPCQVEIIVGMKAVAETGAEPESESESGSEVESGNESESDVLDTPKAGSGDPPVLLRA